MISDPQKRYLLPDSTVCRELGISVRTLQRHILSGKIQPPIGKLAKNRRGWSRAEIDYLREQLAGAAETAQDEAMIA
jgi:hypothetical protein